MMIIKKLIYILVLFITSIAAGETAEQLNETIERRFKVLPEYPEYLHGTSSGIRGTISDATIQLTSGKRLEEYDKWHTIAIDYRSLAEIQLIRARRALKVGDAESAKRCIDESDRDVRIFNSAYLAAISTYQANIEQATHYTKAVYETSHVAFVFTSSFAGLGPVATVASDYLYTATDFTVNTSEEGLSYATKQAVIDILTQQVGKEIFSSGGEAFTVDYKTDIAKILRKLSKDPRFRQSIQETVVTSTQQNLTETFIAETLSNIADEMEKNPNADMQKPNNNSISQVNENKGEVNKIFLLPFEEGTYENAQGFKGTVYEGLYHLGKDYCVNKAGKNQDGSLYGTPFYAIGEGTVINLRFIKYPPENWKDTKPRGVGNYIIVNHGKGIVAVYMHLANVYISVGQKVTADTLLGEAGDIQLHPNGPKMCPHLHIEIRKNGTNTLEVPPNLIYGYISKDGKAKLTEPIDDVLFWITSNFYNPDDVLAIRQHAHAIIGDFATALVIDKSGSMTGDKIKKAKDAAYGYVDASGDKDILSLVGFSTSAQSIVEPSLMSQAKGQLKQDILAVSAGGSTNIGSGLTVAHKHLSSCESKGKMALLMTDGQHNSGTYEPEVEEFVKSGWPIYTVAFGKNADQDTLRKIAEKTNGCFFPADSFNLTSIYNRINVQAHNGSIFRGYSEYIRPGKMLSYIIPIDADSNKIGFFTNWQGSRMETTLTSPSGQIINKSNYSQLGKYSEEQTYTFYEIENPQIGNWQVQIVGLDIPIGGEQINFHSFSYSDISTNILAFQPAYSSNQQVQIAVKVSEMIGDRQSPLQGIKIIADIKKPSSQLKNMLHDKLSKTSRTQQLRAEDLLSIYNEVSSLKRQVQLYDDGQHGDINPGDGIYANSYADTPSNGPYIVTIFLNGNTSTGKQIDRTLQETFQVGPIEDNTFTVSELLNIIANPPKTVDTIKQKVNKEETTKQVINVFDQLFKKRK